MKPFITPESYANGKKLLRFQFEGIAQEEFAEHFSNQFIVGYAMPEGHSFRAAWIFQLLFSGGELLEFSSACTQVGGWEELGSLNVKRLTGSQRVGAAQQPLWPSTALAPCKVSRLDRIVFEDAEVVSECGLIFCGDNGEEFVVTTGIPPGSVSISIPFRSGEFEPEFPVSTCRRELIGSIND